MIFVDTGAWYASVIPDDINHPTACKWLNQNIEPLWTSDFIIDETLTLLKARGYPSIAVEMGEMFFAGELAEIAFVSEEDIRAAWDVFRQYQDKDWSFTDCTCKVIIERSSPAKAFSFDRHFRQFGSVQISP